MKRTRIEEIAHLIEKNGKMSLEELAVQFPDVSDMTLRRDLLELEKENAELKCQLEERRGIFRIQCPTCNSILKFYINKEDAFDGKSAMDDLLTPCYLATKYDNNV